jgi:hypothetical protein
LAEQSENRTENRPGHPASRENSDTLDLYTQEDSDETRAAEGEFLSAVGMNATVQ